MTSKRCGDLFCIALVCFGVSQACAHPIGPIYTLVDLGFDGGVDYVFPRDINEHGAIAGQFRPSGGQHTAFLRDPDGTIHLLPHLSASNSSSNAQALNDQGIVVGSSRQIGNEAVIWAPDGSVIDLDEIAATVGARWSSAVDINQLGQVVGTGAYQVGTSVTRHALLWSSDGGLLDLGVLPGFQESHPAAVNDLRQVAGHCLTPGSPSRAFIWDVANGMRELALPAAATLSRADYLNNLGQVSGVVTVPLPNGETTSRVVRWDGDGSVQQIDVLDFSDLSLPLREVSAHVMGMNDLGQMVGNNRAVTEGFDSFDRWFLYDDALGLIDVGSRIDGSGDQWTIMGLLGINNAGQIIGFGSNGDEQPRAFVLNPVPEPGAQLLTLVAVSTFLCRHSVRRARCCR